jgi:hypothetical protein
MPLLVASRLRIVCHFSCDRTWLLQAAPRRGLNFDTAQPIVTACAGRNSAGGNRIHPDPARPRTKVRMPTAVEDSSHPSYLLLPRRAHRLGRLVPDGILPTLAYRRWLGRFSCTRRPSRRSHVVRAARKSSSEGGGVDAPLRAIPWRPQPRLAVARLLLLPPAVPRVIFGTPAVRSVAGRTPGTVRALDAGSAPLPRSTVTFAAGRVVGGAVGRPFVNYPKTPPAR